MNATVHVMRADPLPAQMCHARLIAYGTHGDNGQTVLRIVILVKGRDTETSHLQLKVASGALEILLMLSSAMKSIAQVCKKS